MPPRRAVVLLRLVAPLCLASCGRLPGLAVLLDRHALRRCRRERDAHRLLGTRRHRTLRPRRAPRRDGERHVHFAPLAIVLLRHELTRRQRTLSPLIGRRRRHPLSLARRVERRRARLDLRLCMCRRARRVGELTLTLVLFAFAQLEQRLQSVPRVGHDRLRWYTRRHMQERHPAPTPTDRYVVVEYLAQGGMGALYLGKKLGLGGFEKEVVLKQLLPEYTARAEFTDLFLREAKLTASLHHANIVQTIDLVTAEDQYFMVMEYVRGADLRKLLTHARRRGRLIAPAAAIHIAREVLAALAYAHEKRDAFGQPLGLIHRDVSPSNILLSTAGDVKLTDFGIAKAAAHDTRVYQVRGKLGYMSPEHAKGEPLDARADLYSLAVCLYELLTGERLHVAESLAVSAADLYDMPVPTVSRKRKGLPAELDSVLWRALAIDPDERYQSALELQQELGRVAHRHGLRSSASELALALVEACGATDTWTRARGRNDDLSHSGLRSSLGHTEVLADDEFDEGDARDEPDAAAADDAYDAYADDAADDEHDAHGAYDARDARPEFMRLSRLELSSVIPIGALADAGDDDAHSTDERPRHAPVLLGAAPGLASDARHASAEPAAPAAPAHAVRWRPADTAALPSAVPEPPTTSRVPRISVFGASLSVIVASLTLLALCIVLVIGLTGPDIGPDIALPPAAPRSSQFPSSPPTPPTAPTIAAPLPGWGSVVIDADVPCDIRSGGASLGHLTTAGPLSLPAGSHALILVPVPMRGEPSRPERRVTVVIRAGEVTRIVVAEAP